MKVKTFPLKTCLRYPGGKSKATKTLSPWYPENFKEYREPFIGGGSVYFHLKPEKAVISDVHKELTDFYQSIKDGFSGDIYKFMEKHPNALLYGQDVGKRLGGVFREAATLAQTFGDDRVFNTPIQEAFIIGSTVGMSAVGLKPFVEVQFADYIWPGLNQLFTEVSRSYYLSNGKWPVSAVIRVPIGAYGSGGPYHSSSVESVLANIRGIKVVYPSTGADLKGLLKAAYYDPNPVVILEHKGLYWSKIPGTEGAMSIEPSEDYVIPIGKARTVLEANESEVEKGNFAGCFKMKFDSKHLWLKLAGWLTQFNWKASRGGDQSLFVTKDLFIELNGFNEQFTIYEDIDFINKLYRIKQFVVIQQWIITSSRRYQTKGIWKLQYHFWMIYIKKWFGASAEQLYAYYAKYIQ